MSAYKIRLCVVMALEAGGIAKSGDYRFKIPIGTCGYSGLGDDKVNQMWHGPAKRNGF